MDAVSQPAPARRRTPRRTYTATRVSHPNCSRFIYQAAGRPSPLTHLWRPPAIAGAGGHAQVDSGTPYRGCGQARARRPGSFVARPGRARAGSAHRPSATLASSPSVVGPACTPAAAHLDPAAPAPVEAARAQHSRRHLTSPTVVGHQSWVTFPLSRGGTHPSPPAPSTRLGHLHPRTHRRLTTESRESRGDPGVLAPVSEVRAMSQRIGGGLPAFLCRPLGRRR